MRPIRLEMTAFGPYKDKEIVDFTELGDRQLFVISGATGAGKTTIFDAICFSLYGNASGSDRENANMLRSHFADDGVHTRVEFVFEIKGRVYRVLRQIGHVKQGNKTKTGEKYELYEQDGIIEIPCTDRQIVSEINQKIEQLIGLTEDQFKQIVMLPQGEFRKLLTSETENKEEILRRLFNTSRYKMINQYLKDRQQLVKEAYHDNERMLNQTIESIRGSFDQFSASRTLEIIGQEYYEPIHVLEGLKTDVSNLKTLIESNHAKYKQALDTYEEEQTQYHKGMELNKKFNALEEKKKELLHLQNDKDAIMHKEQRVKKARLAAGLSPYEQQLNDLQDELKQKQIMIAKQEKDLQAIQLAYADAKAIYEKEEKQEPERDKLKITIQNYGQYLPIVRESAAAKASLHTLKLTIDKQDAHFKATQKKKEELEDNERRLKQDIKRQEEQASTLNEYKHKLEQIKQHYALLNNCKQQIHEQKTLQLHVNDLDKNYQLAKKDYQEYEAKWLNEQAFLLADGLADGDACPVCGSSHHPQLAVAQHPGISKEQLDQKRAAVDHSFDAFNKASRKNDTLLSGIEEKRKQITELGYDYKELDSQLEFVIEQGKKYRSSYNIAEEQANLLVKNKEIQEKLEDNLIALEKSLEQTGHALQENEKSYVAEESGLRERLERVPEKLQEQNALEQTIQALKESLKTSMDNWQQAQQQLKTKEEMKNSLEIGLKHRTEELSGLKMKASTAKDRLNEKVAEAGFADFDEYQQAKLPIQTIEKFESEIEQFNRRFQLLSEQIAEVSRELQGLERADTGTMKDKLAILKQQYETAFEKWNQSQNQRESAEGLISQISSLAEIAAAKEKEAGIITDLYDVLRGQNDRKISFERYLQIDYLDNIIDAANQRFQELMNGQFYLMRSNRQEARGKQSGLAIDVFDGYTGQTRDVKSLSGGEKFIASLCLALGMSDVIQSFQGSININTMFIDEGFGSLDEESLNKAIQTLAQLQEDGRLIGVISHVEELKSIFPAMLQVTKTKDGYSSTAFKLK